VNVSIVLNNTICNAAAKEKVVFSDGGGPDLNHPNFTLNWFDELRRKLPTTGN
jgi:hypothetical protein